MLKPLFKDIATKNPVGGKPVRIEFNMMFTKCKINDHKMKVVTNVFSETKGAVRITTYATKLWDETVYFKVTTRK